MFRLPVSMTAAFAAAMVLAGTPGMAAENDGSTSDKADRLSLQLELNELDTHEGACRITFVARNGLTADLSALAYEMVLFGVDGGIERMTKFAFGAMKQGKTIVRRFNMPGLGCEAISRILINNVSACEGAGQDVCEQSLETSNRTDIEFGL
ncbi:hypothetical protein [Notoacmeibacter sp. MSK16QG-6]|uniref:hypothetical protein n=1 Tax=Notoacmeibacter sp. MSK16QG-6 TaxID=2957982 RepID=UPI0020A0F890|nr:hypothetical protein [Notoacmeibacter sp. MSK16QG-6]MCP1198300.1 hypothetical protein [Notoacmeibacter sp. MSK16QG-6]